MNGKGRGGHVVVASSKNAHRRGPRLRTERDLLNENSVIY